MSTIEKQAAVTDAMADYRFDRAAASLFPEFSRSRLKAWILSGELTLDGASCKPRERVNVGAVLTIQAVVGDVVKVAAERVEFDIVHEDDELIVINKPAGLVVHPGAGNPGRTLQNGLLHRFPELSEVTRGGIIHRLDKDTSGLLLIARTLGAHTRLTHDLSERDIKREYLAVCDGALTGGGRVDAPIARHPKSRTKMAVHPTGRPATTHYRVVERYKAHTLIRVQLETGRTHQIRVHMAHIRHGLVGDATYGPRLKLPRGADEAITEVLRGFRRQALHAERLTLTHPASEELLTVEASPPADFQILCEALAAHRERASDG